MKRKLTHDDYLKRVVEVAGYEYDVIGSYVNFKTHVQMKHNVCGHEWGITPSHFFNGRRCPNCRPNKKMNHDDFESRVFQLVGVEYKVLGRYVNNATPVLVKHLVCGNEYEVKPNNFITNGTRCSTCAGNRKKDTAAFKQEMSDATEVEYELLSEYVGSLEYVDMKHMKCGHVYKVIPSSYLRGSRCPKCNESKGEREIANALKGKGVDFQTQYRIKECRLQMPLPFDFAIFDNGDLSCLIEYEGKQHYEPVKFWGGVKGFELRRRRDQIKRDYCKENGIPLIEIPYWVEDIEGMLTDCMNEILISN